MCMIYLFKARVKGKVIVRGKRGVKVGGRV